MSEAVLGKAGPSLLRTILGVIAGAVWWMLGFLLFAQILVVLWPDYGIPARAWTHTGNYTFSAPMSVCNIFLWIIVEIMAGWLTGFISRTPRAVWVLAALVMAYLCCIHLVFAWSKFPWWYDLSVAFSSGPAVLLGGRLMSNRPAIIAS